MKKNIVTIDILLKLYSEANFVELQQKALQFLKYNTNNSIVLNLMAVASLNLNDREKAKSYFLKAIQIAPKDYSAYNNLGLIYFNEFNFLDARRMFQEALKQNSTVPETYLNLGSIDFEEKKYHAAKENYTKALDLGLVTYKVYFNLAKLFAITKDTALAVQMFEKAIELNPSHADVLFEYALLCLSIKNYLKGFELYRYRYDETKTDRQTFLLDETKLLVKGTNINGKKILLTYEQGFGDIIQFIRFVPFLEKMGARIYVSTKQLLFKLLQTSYPNISFLNENVVVDYDFNMPLLDIAYFLGLKYETIPFQEGYLKVNSLDSSKIEEKYFKDETKKKVGIVWRTNISKDEHWTKQRERESRNCLLEDFIRYFKLDDVQLYSLQVNVTQKERELLLKCNIPSLGDSLVDFYDNALLIDNLDAVIGIDTVSTIIAGAMGKEAIVILSDNADWRWLHEGASTNWFNSINIVRKNGDSWESAYQDARKLDHIFVNNAISLMMQKAIQCHHENQLELAEKLYRKVLQRDANNADAYHFLGIIAYQTGHQEHSIALLQKALSINPNNHEIYTNLQKILTNYQTKFAQQYLNLKTEKFNINQFSVRSTQYTLSNYDKELIVHLKQELDVLEENSVQRDILALYLELIGGDFKIAVQSYLEIQEKGDFEEHLKKLNRLNEIALQVKGFYFEKEEYTLLAEMFYKIFHFNTIELKYQTQYIISYYNFYMIERNRAFQTSLQKVSEIFTSYFSIKLNVEALVLLYDKISFMYWGMSQELNYLKICDSSVTKPFSQYLIDYFQNNQFQRRTTFSSRAKKRICYLGYNTSYYGAYAVGRVMYSVFKGHYELNSGDFEFYYYSYGAVDESFLQEITSFGFIIKRFEQIVNLPEKLKTMRQSFFDDEIDIVISEMPWGIPTYLFESRVAPIQIYFSLGFHYWSLQNMDWLILPKDGTSLEGYQNLVNLDVNLDIKFLIKEIPVIELESERKNYPMNSVVLGAIQRLVKISNIYLKTCEEILLKHNNTILILAGGGEQKHIIEFFKQKNLSSRVFLPGFIDPHMYAQIIDIYLDTFPFPGGHSALEVMAYGKPVVHMYSEDWNLMAKKGRDQNLIAQNVEDYSRCVTQLLKDKEFYAKCQAKALKIIENYTDLKHSADEFEMFFKSLVAEQ